MQSVWMVKSNITLKRGYSGGGNAVDEGVELVHSEHGFLQVEGQPVEGKDGEQGPQVLSVLLLGFAVQAIII